MAKRKITPAQRAHIRRRRARRRVEHHLRGEMPWPLRLFFRRSR